VKVREFISEPRDAMTNTRILSSVWIVLGYQSAFIGGVEASCCGDRGSNIARYPNHDHERCSDGPNIGIRFFFY
jgi:hypothetical protein